MSKMAEIAKLLKHNDPEQRRLAINWLARSDDPAALKLLAWAYKNDPDEELRNQARKGGKYLKQQLDEADNAGNSGSGTGALLAYRDKPKRGHDTFDDHNDYADDDFSDASYYTEDDYDADHEDEAPLSDEPLDWDAKRSIDRAVDAHVEGQDAQALEHIIDALEVDRRARYSHQLLNVLASITDMNGEDALRALANPEERDAMLRAAGGSGGRRVGASGDDPGWGTAWADIGIFTLVNLAGLAILIVLVANRFTPLLVQFQDTFEYQQFMAEVGGEDVLGLFIDSLQETIIVLLAIGAGYVLYVVLITMLQTFAIHFAAINFFGGQKPTSVTFSRMFEFQTIVSVVGYVGVLVLLGLLPNTSIEPYLNEESSVYVTLFISLGCILPIGALSVPIIQSWVIGRAQQFGWGKGCLSTIVGGILYAVASWAFNFFLQILVTIAGVGSG